MDLIGNWIIQFLTNSLDSIMGLCLSLFVSVTSISNTLLESVIIKNAITYTQELATVLLVIKILSDIYKTYMANMAGDQADMQPSQFVLRGIAALLFIWTMPYIVGEMLKIGNLITADVSVLSGETYDVKTYVDGMKAMAMEQINSAVVGLEMVNLTGVIFAIFLGVCLVIIVFQMAKRSVEVAIMAVIGPVFSVNLASQDQSLYKNWFKHLMIVCASQAIQILMLRITFYATTHQAELVFGAKGNPIVILMLIALLIFTLKAPKFLEQFTYSSGGGGGSSLTHLASSAMHLIGKK
jgi:hypothetical protein